MSNQNSCKTNIQTLRLNLAMGAYMGTYGKIVQCSLKQFKQCILFERCENKKNQALIHITM